METELFAAMGLFFGAENLPLMQRQSKKSGLLYMRFHYGYIW